MLLRGLGVPLTSALDMALCISVGLPSQCGHCGSVGMGRSCDNVGKEPQMGQYGRSPCGPTPAEAGNGGWGLTAIRQPLPACPKQELLSEAGPRLAATLGGGWLHLHLNASASTLLKEQGFYFIFTMHWAIPSLLSADRKRSLNKRAAVGCHLILQFSVETRKGDLHFLLWL